MPLGERYKYEYGHLREVGITAEKETLPGNGFPKRGNWRLATLGRHARALAAQN